MISRRLAFAVCAALTLPFPAAACGPWIDRPHLAGMGDLLDDAPHAHFDREIEAWVQTLEVPEGMRARAVRTSVGDEEDVRRALAEHPYIDQLVEGWMRARTGGHDDVSDHIPKEFRMYQRAAMAMARDEVDAVAGMRALLDLPAEERHYRSTWAAYMIGLLEGDYEAKVRAFEQVESLTAAGFADTLGLTAASWRHLAAESGYADRNAESLEHCARYMAAGGRRDCAEYLRETARRVLADPEQLRDAALRPLAAQLVSIALTSDHRGYGDPARENGQMEDWLEAVSATEGAHALAGRLAWAAYQRGNTDLAQAWVERAAPDDAIATWIVAKLALERGDVPEAAASLQSAISAFSAGNGPEAAHCSHDAHGPLNALRVELGIVHIAQDRFVDAMLSFLDAGDWTDAAWVGERLLTTEELTAIVSSRAPVRVDEANGDGWTSGFLPIHHDRDIAPDLEPVLLRPLLGRRLVREGRLSEAREYLPVEARLHLDQVVADLALSRDSTEPNAVRGGAMWRAAFTMKQQGWALSATELEPDQRLLGGWYPGTDVAHERHERVRSEQVVPTTDEEKLRLDQSGGPDDRYHFVWTSTELAFQALELMPDDHADLPQAGCITAHWMRHRSPKLAWKALLQVANRAPEHPLATLDYVGLGEDGRCVEPEAEPMGWSSWISQLLPDFGWL